MSSRSPTAIFAGIAMAAMLNTGSAQAEPGAAATIPGAMVSRDRAMAPPIGLLDFCEREPAACSGPSEDRADVAQAVARARGLAWREILVGADRSAQPGSVEEARTGRAANPHSTDGKFLGGLEVAGLLGLDGEAGKVRAINAALNRAIAPTPDRKLHGQQDFWTIPRSQQGGRLAGDCEDYVLAKREALLRLGIAPERLSIALARTPEGEDHAVLLLAYPDGDYVLDNRDSRMLHWSRASLTWQARQRPGELLRWVRL